MKPINYLAVVITGFAAFILSLLWYSSLVFGNIWMHYRSISHPGIPAWTMLFAPLRELIASYVLASLFARLSISNWKNAVKLVLLLWLAFHAVGIAGAVLWDNMHWQLGVVHAGDWLMKMVFMAVVLSAWQRKIK